MKDNKSLFELRRFRWTVFGVLTVSVAIAIYVNQTSKLFYLPGYEGLNKAVEIFRVPLGVLALIVPAVAVIAASHRSEQTKKQIDYASQQIDEMRKQNTFNTYYKHVEEFDKYLDALQSSYQIEPIVDRKQLYKMIFPKNSPAEFNLKAHTNAVGQQLWLEYYKEQLDYISASSASELNAADLIECLLWLSRSFYFIPNEGVLISESTNELGDVIACRMVMGNEGPVAHLNLCTRFLAQLAYFAQINMADTPAINVDSSFFSAEMEDELKGYVSGPV